LDVTDRGARKYTVEMPDLNTGDNKAIAETLSSLSSALEKGVASGLIDTETAQKLMFSMAGIDRPDNFAELIEQEKTERDAKAQREFAQQLMLTTAKMEADPGGKKNGQNPGSKPNKQ